MSMKQTNKKCKSCYFYFLIKNGLLNKTVRRIRRLACMERKFEWTNKFQSSVHCALPVNHCCPWPSRPDRHVGNQVQAFQHKNFFYSLRKKLLNTCNLRGMLNLQGWSCFQMWIGISHGWAHVKVSKMEPLASL